MAPSQLLKRSSSNHKAGHRLLAALAGFLVLVQMSSSLGVFRGVMDQYDGFTVVVVAEDDQRQLQANPDGPIVIATADEASRAVAVKDQNEAEEEERNKKFDEAKREARIKRKQAEASARKSSAGGKGKQTFRNSQQTKRATNRVDWKEDDADSIENPFAATPSTNSTEDPSIRRWGCARNETPFIFVHIGKAGGGGVRARIAASALEYNRERWQHIKNDSSYYYPMYDESGTLHPGKLSHSDGANMLPHSPKREDEFPFTRTFTFEGTMPCHATTPLGHAVGCPMEKDVCRKHRGNVTAEDTDRCDLVYMGHNVLGGEMNFLPTGYLVNWWKNTSWAKQQQQQQEAPESRVLARLGNRYNRSHRVWNPKERKQLRQCKNGPLRRMSHNKYYEKCIRPEIREADKAAKAVMADSGLEPGNWGPVYASMPLLRVTMLREPFSWLKSKFFWMEYHMNTEGVDGQVLAYRGDFMMKKQKANWDEKKRIKYQNAVFVKCDDIDNFARGWGKQAALECIFYLCGEHCMGQWQAIQNKYQGDSGALKTKHAAYLKSMEAQAAYNLRNSFAVVGLLQETKEFFEMISQRVFYMDTSLNPQVEGASHSSGFGAEIHRCSQTFGEKAFRKTILRKGPEIAAMLRLYDIGVQVNKFQKEELQQCSA